MANDVEHLAGQANSLERPVAAYCGSGVNAAQVVLAGALAGIETTLYVGSWSEWVADPTRPIAVGAEPGPS
jgi:thiosulfate/3-mercaptopyruvate sulfurtransferase